MLPFPQRINALNEVGTARNLDPGSRETGSLIIGKGLAFPDFKSRLQHLGPRPPPKRTLPDSKVRSPVFQRLERKPGTWRSGATNPGDSPSRASTRLGLRGIIFLLLSREFADSVGKC